MKYILLIILFLDAILVVSQSKVETLINKLDTAKLAVFSINGSTLTQSQINKADSILINVVNYYNSRIERDYSLILTNLNESDYKEVLKIDSLRNIYNPYLTKKGKLNNRKISKLDSIEKSRILKLIACKASNDSTFLSYMYKDKTARNDTIVWSYGSKDKIEINNYYRQYIVSEFKNGTIYIHAICFCPDIVNNSRIDWKKLPIKIYDGGSCVFSVELDLKNGTAKKMRVNNIR